MFWLFGVGTQVVECDSFFLSKILSLPELFFPSLFFPSPCFLFFNSEPMFFAYVVGGFLIHCTKHGWKKNMAVDGCLARDCRGGKHRAV